MNLHVNFTAIINAYGFFAAHVTQPQFFFNQKIEAAQKAVSMDQVETQIQEHDSQYQFPSPISKLNLNCGHETEEDSSGDDGEEGAEEEMKTHDECIEPIEPHDPCTYLIESDGESVLSPRKAKVCPTPSEALPEVKEVPEPVAGSGAGAMLQDNLLDEPPPPSHEEQVYIEEAEAILDSDEEKKANKGVFKDLVGCDSLILMHKLYNIFDFCWHLYKYRIP